MLFYMRYIDVTKRDMFLSKKWLHFFFCLTYVYMDGWIDRWMDRLTDGRMDGWMEFINNQHINENAKKNVKST